MRTQIKLFSGLKDTNFGLTLLELMIVIVIIGILASIGYVNYGRSVEKARGAEAYSVLSEIVAAEQAYYVENDSYTSDFSKLATFTASPTSDNFTYSIPSTDSSSGYTQAARKSSTSGRLSYGMCLESGKRASCDKDTCDPACP